MKKNLFVLLLATITFFFAIKGTAQATNVTLIKQGDIWNYSVITTPMPNFYSADYSSFDWENAIWLIGQAPFGNIYSSTYLLPYNTEWLEKTYLALNKIINVNGTLTGDLTLNVASDNGFIFFVNGEEVNRFWASGYTSYWEYTISVDPSFFSQGLNTISVLAQDQGGATFFDMELYGDLQVELPINLILEFFDQSVTDGTLTGYGNGNSANNRLDSFRNQLQMASDLIEIGDIDGACVHLKVASEKCDGHFPPPDFVVGEAATTLYNMILELMAELGCE